MAHKRLFIGIPLPENIRKAAIAVRRSFSGQAGIRWTNEENLHVTLFFIGQTDDQLIPKLSADLSQIAGSTPPFRLTLHRFSYMPPKRPRMIWSEFASSDAFSGLALELRQRFGHLRKDEHEDEREPRPHATMARFKFLPPKERAELPASPPLQMHVDTVILYESHLSSEGSKYEVLESFRLKDARR